MTEDGRRKGEDLGPGLNTSGVTETSGVTRAREKQTEGSQA